MSAARATAQRQTVEAFMDAWRRLSVNDIVALRTSDCLQTAHPEDTLEWPARTNEEFIAAIGPMFGTLSNFEVTLLSITNDGEAGRAAVHAKTKADATWGDYRNEHVLIFTFNEDGSKMTKVQDMFDSAEMLKRMEKVAEFQKK